MTKKIHKFIQTDGLAEGLGELVCISPEDSSECVGRKYEASYAWADVTCKNCLKKRDQVDD